MQWYVYMVIYMGRVMYVWHNIQTRVFLLCCDMYVFCIWIIFVHSCDSVCV